jgi:hypothetical protein
VPVTYLYFDKLATRLQPRKLEAAKEHEPAPAD